MMNTGKLAGRTLFVTGGSRGIGKAIALKAAKDGANVVIAAKTAEPHPKLPGTIFTAAKEVEDAGGKALPCVVDVREEKSVIKAVDEAVKKFGGIDILINNASAISLTGTLETEMKRYDLMHHVNTRGTFLVSKACLPHLKKGNNPHIVNLSPPLNMNPIWFKNHVAYTMAKYGMSMCVLGMSEEFKSDGVAVNALWPKTSNKEFFPDSFLDIDTTGAIFKTHNQKKATQTQKRMMSTQAGDGGVDGIFTAIKSKLNSDIVNSTQCVFQFNLTGGDKEETYHIDLKNGEGSAGKGKPAESPDATLTMNTENFQKLFEGKLKATSAFMTGKLKISGNMQKAMKLEKLLTSLKSKM